MRTEFEVEFELEEDGRCIAEVIEMPGVLAYGSTLELARVNAESLARDVVQEQSPS
jgi:predicted RNase H-like HicB family nuclease